MPITYPEWVQRKPRQIPEAGGPTFCQQKWGRKNPWIGAALSAWINNSTGLAVLLNVTTSKWPEDKRKKEIKKLPLGIECPGKQERKRHWDNARSHPCPAPRTSSTALQLTADFSWRSGQLGSALWEAEAHGGSLKWLSHYYLKHCCDAWHSLPGSLCTHSSNNLLASICVHTFSL